MIIGLFGDSFGVQKLNQPFDGWVNLLSKHCNIVNHCQSGASQYRILQQLKTANVDKFDQIIITHTSPSRLFVRSNPVHANSEYHQNCDVIFTDVESRQDEFSRACQLYFKHIYDEEFNFDLHNLICQEIDTKYKNNILHITHFDYDKLYQFPNMINFHNLWCSHRGSVNHYDQIGNYQVYKHLLDKLGLCNV